MAVNAPIRDWTTIILVRNIHCGSCMDFIRDSLSAFRPALKNVDINLVSHEVRLLHDPSLSLEEVCLALHNAAFELYSATVVDGSGVQRRELEFLENEDDWFEATKSNLEFSAGATIGDPHSTQLREQKDQRTHLENCDACQKESGGVTGLDVKSVDEKVREVEPARLRQPSGVSDGTQMESDTSFGSDLYSKHSNEAVRYEATLSIGGMTCASCTSAIDRGLLELDFVHYVNVVLMTNSAAVVYSGGENLQAIVDAVEDLGYECGVDTSGPVSPERPNSALVQNSRRSLMLKIDGMFCRHCPPRIAEALESNFQETVTIDKTPTLSDPIIGVSYLPSPPTFTIRDIVRTIDGLNSNFKATIYSPPSIEQRSQTLQRHEQRRLFARLLLSFTIVVPTFLIGVVWMSLVPPTNSTRQFFSKPVWSGAVSRTDWALFILATPVMFCAADVFHVRALKEIRALWRRGSRVPILKRFYRFGSMNLLISAGTSVAYFSSIAILIINATTKSQSSGQGSTYFDSVVFLTFFILIGRWLEAYSKAKTGNAIALLVDLKPQEATLVTSSSTSMVGGAEVDAATYTSSNHRTEKINAKLLEVGDVVVVPHGSSPPADGIVVTGSTKFNQSAITGEAKPVAKDEKDTVFSGAVNIGGPIQVRVTDVGGTSMLDQIVSVVREGQTRRAPVERTVDIVTGYFVPVITALAIITWIIWVSLGQSGALSTRYLGSSKGGWAFWSLDFAIAVFVVACPCGIGLAAPTALFVGSGLAAKHGILVRGGGEAFQEASNIDAVVFDKTGTLTEGGDLKVTDHEIYVNEDEEANLAWSITKTLEETSSHPLARAILEFASSQPSNMQITTISITEEAGKGLRGTFTTPTTTYEAALGSEALINSLSPAPKNYFTTTTLSLWKSHSKSIALLALRQLPSSSSPESKTPTPWTLTTAFAIADPIRASTIPTLNALKSRHIPVYMLTGDNPTTARAVASTLSIPLDHVFAGVLPTEKASRIHWLQENVPKRSPTTRSMLPPFLKRSHNNTKKKTSKATMAFVGDGINDAPALSAASVSISLASGTDIAMHTSSFVLLTSTLTSIITLFDLSSKVFSRVKWNFAWAVVYNAILVPVAAGVFFGVGSGGWRLSPVWGSAAMAASSVCVVGSSLALKVEWGWRRKGGED